MSHHTVLAEQSLVTIALYLPIKIDGGGREGSIHVCRNSSGRIESLGDVYLAARIGVGGPLNVAAFRGTLDAKGRDNGSMSINGGR